MRTLLPKIFGFDVSKTQIRQSTPQSTPRSTLLIIGLTSLVVMGLLFTVRQWGGLQPLELLVYDRWVQLRPERSTHNHLLLVAITEPDLRESGWPISDRDLATVLAHLQTAQPKVIGLDLYRDLPQEPGHAALVQELQAENLITIEDVGAGIPAPPMVPRERIGFNDLVLDPDGAIRRGLLFVPDAQQPQGGFYAFSLRLVLAYLGESRTQDQGSAVEESVESIAPQAANPLFQVDPNKALVLKGQRFERLEPHSGGYSNIDTGGYQVLLDFHSRQSVVQRVTFQEVLTNQVPASLIHDRIVLIGTTAPSLKDGFRTPYSSGESEDFLLPGVLVHAQIANSLLEALMENHHLLGYWPEIWEFVWIGLWIGAMGILSWWVRRPLVSTIVFLLAGFGLVMITYGLFLSNVWVPLVSPLVGGTIVSASIVGYRAYEFQQQQQIVMRLLGQNTSPEIAETLWNSRDRLLKSGKLPGQRLTATIMFADIRNFSTTAELLSPEALMDWLNVCLEPVTQEIQQHHGIVNKFTGDGFMAVFGLPMARVPAEISQDAQQAVACALAIAGHLRTLNAAWKPQDLPLMQMRIGIFTGPVTAGSLGGKDRMEYGIIGDTVNIASRLESCAKERHVGTCRVLIGQETYDCLDGRFKVEDWGPMALKGKAQMVNVYRVIDPNDPEEAIDLVARHA